MCAYQCLDQFTIQQKYLLVMFQTDLKPPYYAVIFTSTRTESDGGYGDMANKMVEMASAQPGFLGVDSARQDLGITVSYWKSSEDIADWKRNSEHRHAQKLGRDKWYTEFTTRICKVEREYSFSK